MKVKLINQNTYDELKSIAEEHPALISQSSDNYLKFSNPEAWIDKKPQVDRIEAILREHIVGFTEFDNFKRGKEGLQLRLQYNWGAADNSMPFAGVGYILLTHLRDGFPQARKEAGQA